MKIIIIPVGMLQTNCCLLIDEETNACAVIDPGAASHKILEVIQQNGLKVESIILTHGHFDHIMAAPEIQAKTGARLYIHRADQHMLAPDYVGHAGYIREDYAMPRIDGFLEDGMTLPVGSLECTVLNTPGHTPGSCVVLCQDAMLAGDTLFNGSCGRTDLDGGNHADMLASLARLRDLPGDRKVYPGHMDTTTLERERRTNPFFPQA